MPDVIIIGPDGKPQVVTKPAIGGLQTPAQTFINQGQPDNSFKELLKGVSKGDSVFDIVNNTNKLAQLGLNEVFKTGSEMKDRAMNDRQLSPFQAAVDNTMGSLLTSPQDIKEGVTQTVQQVSEALGEPFTPRYILDEKQAQKQRDEQRAQEESLKPFLEEERQRGEYLQQVMGSINAQGGGTGNAFDMGKVFLPGGPPSLPPPPPGPNYEEVYSEVIKNMPEAPNPVDFQGQRTVALIAGLASGLLKMQDGNLGQVLLGMGLGALTGVANADAAKEDAIKEFKDRMMDYHNRVAQVKRLQAESDNEYAQRVWQFNNSQIMARYQAGKERLDAMNSKVYQSGNGFFISEVVPNADGTARRVMRFYDPSGTTNNIANVQKVLEKQVGKDAANTITLNMAQGLGPRATAEWIISKAKADGKWSGLVKKFGADKGMMQAGMELSALPGGTESEKNKMIDRERDVMLVEILMSHPAVMMDAAKDLGIGNQAFAMRHNINPFIVGQ